MELRIIAGHLGGRRIRLNAVTAKFRPTSERVREAVAESLRARIDNAVVADLCAGSGAFGFEMLSRGARSVDFVENNRARLHAIARHVAAFGVQEHCRVVTRDVRRFAAASRRRRYNIVFYDPPYGDGSLVRLVPRVAALLCDDGMMVYEHSGRDGGEEILRTLRGYGIVSRNYGGTIVSYVTR